MVEGFLGRKFGFDTFGNNQMPSHTVGTLTDLLVNDPGDGIAVGDKTVPVDSAAGGTWVEGDIVTFAGDTQTYVATNGATLGAAGTGNLTIEPGLLLDPGNNAAITLDASRAIAGLAFHASAFAFASRPLMDFDHPAIIMSSAMDPISGISLRITAEWVNKTIEWSIDILYGGEVTNPEAIAHLSR
jgi:hypothetical protein